MSDGRCILYTLPADVRSDFARPRGLIKSGDFLSLIPINSPSIVCVGDVVSSYCKKISNYNGLLLLIVDGKTRRSVTIGKPTIKNIDKIIEINNPPGTISSCAMTKLCRLLWYKEKGKVLILVNGEEDMLALPAIACSEPGSVVVYGIPHKGAAIINVTRFTLWDAQSRLLLLEPKSTI